jgi:hypothetical protein
MTANDFFYVALGFGFLVLVAGVVTVAIQISRILQDVKKVTGNVSDITTDVATLKDGIKIAVLKLVEKMLSKTKKGGDDKDE